MEDNAMNLHIENSYNIWSIRQMVEEICREAMEIYGSVDVPDLLNRPWCSMYIEWWLHNIGYYLTKPFEFMSQYNIRFQDVDLQSWFI